MSLGLWGRFLIMVAGASVVVVAVIVVACFVGPGCWGFEYLQGEEKSKKKKTDEKKLPDGTNNINSKLNLNNWLGSKDYVVFRTGPEEQIHKVDNDSVCSSKERVFNIKCAPLLVAPNLYSTIQDLVPKLEVKLLCVDLGQDDMIQFTVFIVGAAFLRWREYNAALDPYVSLEIINSKWLMQKKERIVHTAQTQVVKNDINPKFDEKFSFNVKKTDIKNWCVKLTIIDNDRLTKPTPLFEKRIYLKDLKNLPIDNHLFLCLEMQEVSSNVGSLFLGVSYLPTAQRLNISVVKASRLKFQNLVQSLTDFHPYVKVIMINSHGRCVTKKKSCCRHGDENPVFNHSLVFDSSISNLEQTVFLILLCNRTMTSNSDDSSSVEGDIESSLKETKDKVLGWIVLGRNVKRTQARDHWVTVMQNPRKVITMWHDLR